MLYSILHKPKKHQSRLLLGNIQSHSEPRVFICVSQINLTLSQEAALATS